MAKAVAARTFGDDYQALFFWLQACRLFDDRPKVIKVEIEPDNIKSLDDVAVHYSGMYEYCNPVASDFFQVKFHVAANGAFTWQGMMDPAFINAKSVSLLQRVRNAQIAFAPSGSGCRFYVYSPWSIHPDDALGELISHTDGHLRWEVLAEGGARSKFGKIRAEWQTRLKITSDEELRAALAPLRLQQGPSLEQLREVLNDKLQLAGFKSVPAGAMNHPYEGLARKFVQAGRLSFTRTELELVCRNENLWIGRPALEPEARRLGIRSFLRFAEHIEDETDEYLCLLKYFEGRTVRRAEAWNNNILPEVVGFLRRCVKPGLRYLLHIPAHGSVAFAAGWCLDSKSGADVALIQPGAEGRQIWRPDLSIASRSFPELNVASIPVGVQGQEVVLAISITHNIESDVSIYVKKHLPAVSRIIHCYIPAPGAASIVDANHGYFLAQNISSQLKTQRNPQERAGRVHIFFAAPNALTFFLGQHARSFGSLTLYEYDFDTNAPGAYSPSVSLPMGGVDRTVTQP